VDVHRVFDILREPEGKFGRLRSNFDYTATNYTRPTRLLYCVIRLPEVVSLNYSIVCVLTC